MCLAFLLLRSTQPGSILVMLITVSQKKSEKKFVRFYLFISIFFLLIYWLFWACIMISRVHTYLIMNWVNGMRIWRAVRGEGSELGSSSEPGVLPSPRERGPSSAFGPDPKAPHPLLGCNRTGSVALGWWRDSGRTRDNGGKAAWLFIGVLSSVYWVSDVITDDELAVLIIRACSSRNLFVKHHFTSSHLLNNELGKRYAYLACCPRRGLRSSVVVPEPGVLPSPRERGSELGIWPGPKSSQRMLIMGQPAK